MRNSEKGAVSRAVRGDSDITVFGRSWQLAACGSNLAREGEITGPPKNILLIFHTL